MGKVLVERRGGRRSSPDPEKDSNNDDDDAIEEEADRKSDLKPNGHSLCAMSIVLDGDRLADILIGLIADDLTSFGIVLEISGILLDVVFLSDELNEGRESDAFERAVGNKTSVVEGRSGDENVDVSTRADGR